MIQPNMATMLSYIASDVTATKATLKACLPRFAMRTSLQTDPRCTTGASSVCSEQEKKMAARGDCASSEGLFAASTGLPARLPGSPSGRRPRPACPFPPQSPHSKKLLPPPAKSLVGGQRRAAHGLELAERVHVALADARLAADAALLPEAVPPPLLPEAVPWAPPFALPCPSTPPYLPILTPPSGRGCYLTPQGVVRVHPSPPPPLSTPAGHSGKHREERFPRGDQEKDSPPPAGGARSV
jgi:hypothetical protein